MQKQERLDELLVEYKKKNTLLQILTVPYYKAGINRKVVIQQKAKYKELENEVAELEKVIEGMFYGEEG